ncbi:hypothetical protein [Paraburkholderia adhaesiva]|uniref:hypothetical protein n=1 Tax=Paraburkholderia adhaesiva TaxID=2883244 RepID=UPI0027E467C7|nr:hypothetical protein [Paraburkholderia adhaesiva]
MTTSFEPTEEQHAVLEVALRGGDLKIKAFAGAGKTSTLELVARQFPQRRGLYLAFNREIAASAARRFPPSVRRARCTRAPGLQPARHYAIA